MIMQNTMNYRGVIRCEYSIVKPGIFARIINFFKAAFAVRKTNEHGLSNAMEARLYL